MIYSTGKYFNSATVSLKTLSAKPRIEDVFFKDLTSEFFPLEMKGNFSECCVTHIHITFFSARCAY